MLSTENFKLAGSLTQFVSIDLLIEHQGRYLLGLRSNNPAKGTYFVPGSKTFKDMTIQENFERITDFELGTKINHDRSEFIGVFDHMYDHNFQDSSYGTHYVVIAVLIRCNNSDEANALANFSNSQHKETVWMTKEEILASPQVHQFTKNYFINEVTNCFFRQRVL